MVAVPVAGVLAADVVKTANGSVEGVDGTQRDPRVSGNSVRARRPSATCAGSRRSRSRTGRAFARRHSSARAACSAPIFGDMNFRSNGMSEDCLYLNVWTPAKSADRAAAGAGLFLRRRIRRRRRIRAALRRRERWRAKGIVALTVNYRLGVFGFFAHPELTKESPQHASAITGCSTRPAALQWVQDNIAAFGGDPKKVTIAGESAGSIAVSALMASPLSKRPDRRRDRRERRADRADAAAGAARGGRERAGVKFAESSRRGPLAALRAMPTEQIHEAAAKLPVWPIPVDNRRLLPPEGAGRDLRRRRAGARAAARRVELRGERRRALLGANGAHTGELRRGASGAAIRNARTRC